MTIQNVLFKINIGLQILCVGKPQSLYQFSYHCNYISTPIDGRKGNGGSNCILVYVFSDY